MELNMQESAAGISMQLAGELGIEIASELRERLLQAIDGAAGVLLDCRAVSGVHAAALQVLYAAHCYAVAQQKSLRIEQVSEALRTTAAAAGFVCANLFGEGECDGENDHDR